MLKSHEKFYSANGKRLILIADDEPINRSILGNILEEQYEIMFAEDGSDAIEKMKENREIISLVLLDLIMPGLSGLEVLSRMKADPDISHLPVIVVSADLESEAETLHAGALDFISKPFPQPDVIMARVLRTIELSENRDIISSTERDPLTGLYNREFFFRYAVQYDNHHKSVDMDAIIIDVNHFRMINERFGTAYGDEVLRRIGEKVREMVRDTGGIVARRNADTFMIYCPHGKDYQAILDNASIGLAGEGDDELINSRVRLRMGVYARVDKGIEIERRFSRAKMAADKVRESYNRNIGIYNRGLHEKELHAERMIDAFPAALKDEQFVVYYQPKYDIRPGIPVMAGAEALVRWKHPEMGMIPPNDFIPLFEENGLIRELDNYVWRHAAAQLRIWKDKYGFSVPVSVNVSRVDMYDEDLIETFAGLLREYELTADDLHLEITESAYTRDSEQIIETVNMLRELGFSIEMDDFGTGYSSLSMISRLPVDALKLDIEFIRAAFRPNGNTKMIEIIIDIADYLGVPVIAEGVETAEQLKKLREMGCDIVQGYYFSRPVPPEEYEKFVEERKYYAEIENDAEGALSSDFRSIYYIDTKDNSYVEFSARVSGNDLHIERTGKDFFKDIRQTVVHHVDVEDQRKVLLGLNKKALLKCIRDNGVWSETYRLAGAEDAQNSEVRAAAADTHDDHHIAVGFSDINSEETRNGRAAMDESYLNSITYALTRDAESLYFVDVNTGHYMEFRNGGEYDKIHLEIRGMDFFKETRQNMEGVIYEGDLERVAAAMDRDTLLAVLNHSDSFSMSYRLMIDDEPVYYRLKAVWAEGARNRHMVVGVSSAGHDITHAEINEAGRMNNVTFSRIARALSQDYFTIYYVDVESGWFIEYSASDEYHSLGIEKSGNDFFAVCRRNVQKYIYEHDRAEFLEVFTKENVLREVRRNRAFTFTYRLMFRGEPVYVHMKISGMEGGDDTHLVVGISNVDEQIKREQEHQNAVRVANQDPLTGVKSKHAYIEEEERVNKLIRENIAGAFALAVCDINGLKKVNDNYGHTAGDKYIKDACNKICRIFKHSPVYRIGGDEFVVILRETDYRNRDDLIAEMDLQNIASRNRGEATIAFGIAEYNADKDNFVSDVFDRADRIMYERKDQIKKW